LRFLNILIKVFKVLLLLSLLTIIKINNEKKKDNFESYYFFYQFLFLVYYIYQLVYIDICCSLNYQVVIYFYFLHNNIFSIIFTIVEYKKSNFKIVALFELIAYLRIIFIQISQKKKFQVSKKFNIFIYLIDFKKNRKYCFELTIIFANII